ncbi:MAG: hypothetical protein IKL32_01690, partial [Alphaproteobacteria bacterium]|nr:hypothetical protein [Alphaproteobacteria bacterium]
MDNYRPLNPQEKGASETNFKINFIGLILGIFFLLYLKDTDISIFWKFTGLTILISISVSVMEFLCYEKNSALGLLHLHRKHS